MVKVVQSNFQDILAVEPLLRFAVPAGLSPVRRDRRIEGPTRPTGCLPPP